jgi:hypothetical protein
MEIEKLARIIQHKEMKAQQRLEKVKAEADKQMEKMEAARNLDKLRAKQDKMQRQLDMMKADQEKKDLQQQIKALTEGQQRYLPRVEYQQQPASRNETQLIAASASLPAQALYEHMPTRPRQQEGTEHQAGIRQKKMAKTVEIARQEADMQRELEAIKQEEVHLAQQAQRRKAAIAEKQYKLKAT